MHGNFTSPEYLNSPERPHYTTTSLGLASVVAVLSWHCPHNSTTEQRPILNVGACVHMAAIETATEQICCGAFIPFMHRTCRDVHDQSNTTSGLNSLKATNAIPSHTTHTYAQICLRFEGEHGHLRACHVIGALAPYSCDAGI